MPWPSRTEETDEVIELYDPTKLTFEGQVPLLVAVVLGAGYAIYTATRDPAT